MLLMGFNGCEVYDTSPVADWLTKDGLGGVILFDKNVATGNHGKNLKTRSQIKQLVRQLQYYAQPLSMNDDEKLPLLISIDYEGGAVDRLVSIDGCMPTLRAVDLAKLDAEDLTEELSQMAETLHSLGFNLNFAPVVDLDLTHQGIIGALGRSYSSDPVEVVRVASQFVNIFHKHGLATCYKHFPGHGSAVGDTHTGFVDVTTTFSQDELSPYKTLFSGMKTPTMVMTAHVINQHLDPEGMPATLSKPILTGLLRDSLGFAGVVISDDLQMHAIANHYTLADSLKLTINAGADMVIFANQLGAISAPEVIDCVEELVLTKQIEMERIDEAFGRVMRLKSQLYDYDDNRYLQVGQGTNDTTLS